MWDFISGYTKKVEILIVYARGLDLMTTDLVVADPDRSENTICLAVSPSLKAKGVSNRCRIIIADQYAPRDSTLFQRNCIGNFICIIAQFADDNTTRFIYEIAVSSLMPLFLSNSVRQIYSLFNAQMGLGLDEKEFQIVSVADTAVRIELQLDMLRRTNMKPTYEDCIELASNMQIIMGRLFKMNEAEVQEAIELAKEVIKVIDFGEIRLLV